MSRLQLVGFRRISLAAGQSITVSFLLQPDIHLTVFGPDEPVHTKLSRTEELPSSPHQSGRQHSPAQLVNSSKLDAVVQPDTYYAKKMLLDNSTIDTVPWLAQMGKRVADPSATGKLVWGLGTMRISIGAGQPGYAGANVLSGDVKTVIGLGDEVWPV
ncbi:unnamed protein product [Protopolystoma xenopodis]|uniref:Uncharacterized protein n=1 Tax=Protopolystoma xenopodis TaxID=117903 RepID=A0A448X073_9PLAT|nr:unnamed protein product [Protopolystoma xenopodis]